MRTLKSRRDGLGLVKMSDSSGDISEKNQNLFDKFSHFCDSHVSQLKVRFAQLFPVQLTFKKHILSWAINWYFLDFAFKYYST